MNKTLCTAAAITATLLALGSNTALAQVAQPTKVLDSANQLQGLNGVTVGGTRYDVRFVAGQDCVQAFSGCVAQNFAFNTDTDALAASNAMGAALDYSDFGAPAAVFTPYQASSDSMYGLTVSAQRLNLSPLGESVQGWGLRGTVALGVNERFAVFSPSVSAVPEPAGWALMVAGLGIVGLVSGRKARR